MLNISSGDSQAIVRNLYQYMVDEGLVFKSVHIEDSTPYAILRNGTSIGHRTRSKWNKTGVVFFCSKDGIDANRISQRLGIDIDDNSTDQARPFALFVPDSMVKDAVAILKENEDNTKTSRFSASRKESYQQKYWDEYLLHVKQCLRRDGYSDSDSSAETAARDTFYLERKDPSDFLSWFVSPDRLDAAKRRIEELLISANRRSSNLKLDIKYYSRDLEYFYEFINGTSDGSHSQDGYQFIKNLNNKTNVQLVKSSENGKFYVRKRYTEYNADVFKKLMASEITGIPRLYEVEVKGKELWTIEDYIDGETLLEIFENAGPFSEETLKPIILELCGILSRLHDKDILHRDIKPSNIILNREKKVVLIDFNASKEYRDNASEDTVWAGTDYFAAPEQKGFGSSSRATDVFGVGATMSYLLTGMYYLQMIAPGAFHDVIKKCTEIDPKNRYQSMEELINALNEC